MHDVTVDVEHFACQFSIVLFSVVKLTINLNSTCQTEHIQRCVSALQV